MDYLAKNYFSRTADQNISASLEFVDVAFQNGVTAPKVNLTGNVNDLDLREFLETVLLDGMDQIFEQTPYLDECYIKSKCMHHVEEIGSNPKKCLGNLETII